MLELVVFCLVSQSVLIINPLVMGEPYDYYDLSSPDNLERSYNSMDQIAPAESIETIMTRRQKRQQDNGNVTKSTAVPKPNDENTTTNGTTNEQKPSTSGNLNTSEVTTPKNEQSNVTVLPKTHLEFLQLFNKTFNEMNDTYFNQKDKYKELVRTEVDNRNDLKKKFERNKQIVDQYEEQNKNCTLDRIDKMKQTIIGLNLTYHRLTFLAKRNSSYINPGDLRFSSYESYAAESSFDRSSGYFTAPYRGIFHFYFSALKMKSEVAGTSKLTVQLIKTLIDKNSTVVVAEGHINSNEEYGWFPMQVQATMELMTGESVNVKLVEGSLFEIGKNDHILTKFGGFLITFT